MKKFKKLSRDEMKNVLGGYPPPGCQASTCSGGGCNAGEQCKTIDCCDGDVCSAYLTCVKAQ